MFSRWKQENFFKYMCADFDFDRMIEYGTEPVDQKLTIPNPEYKVLTYSLKKTRKKNQGLKPKLIKRKMKVINTALNNSSM